MLMTANVGLVATAFMKTGRNRKVAKIDNKDAPHWNTRQQLAPSLDAGKSVGKIGARDLDVRTIKCGD